MSNKAYITLMSTNNYLYGCIGLMYSWKNTNSKYPFYCVVTKEITQENIRILEAIGYKIIVDDLYVPESYLKMLEQCESEGSNDVALGYSTSDFTKNGWQYAWTKLRIFNYTQFDKLLYIDADSYIVNNLDEVLDKPAWSSVCEYDTPWNGIYRLHSAFFVIEPGEKVYNDLLELAELNPIIKHPITGENKLSNDYDLINLYLKDWGKNAEQVLPNYTYVDSYIFRPTDFFLPFLLQCFTKIKAIHLTGDKPWIEGTQLVQNYQGDWSLWKELYLIYIKFLNKALKDIHFKGIASLPLVK